MTCLTKNCNRTPIARGLCKTCYDRLRKRVQRSRNKEHAQNKLIEKYKQHNDQNSIDELEWKKSRRKLYGNANWGDFISSGECKPAQRCRGLTTAMRRKNALEAIRYRCTLLLHKEQND